MLYLYTGAKYIHKDELKFNGDNVDNVFTMNSYWIMYHNVDNLVLL